MKAKGCLVAAVVLLIIGAIGLALVGPGLLRAGERVYRPIARMKGAQTEFETWSDQHTFKVPEGVVIASEQLDRFLTLRRRLDSVNEKNPLPVGDLKRNQAPDLSQIEGLLQGVGGAVTGRMDAYREVDMPPAEYRYLERVIYRVWLRPLRAKGIDPAAAVRAAGEIAKLAASQGDASLARHLKRLADELATRRVPAPDGFPAAAHELLLSKAAEIDALIDVGSSASMRGGPSVDF